MRISDWSSDVCSSDLMAFAQRRERHRRRRVEGGADLGGRIARHNGRAEKAGGGGGDQLDRAGTGDAQHRTIGLDASTLGADACACFERQAAGYSAFRVVAAAHRYLDRMSVV